MNGRIVVLILWLAASFAVRADDSGLVQLTHDGHLKQRPVISPDGSQMVFARHVQDRIQLFVRTLTEGESTESRLTTSNNPEYDAAYAPDGKRLAFSYDNMSPNQGDIEVYLVTVEGQRLTPLFISEQGLSHQEWPCWSPDGKRIAYTSTQDSNQELYVADADGSNRVRLTSDPAIDAHPAWSPDGSTIAFATNRWGDLDIAVINPDGSRLRRLTSAPGLDDYPCWSPDGRTIAFASSRSGDMDVYFMDPAGENVTNFTRCEGVDSFPAFHPDGRLVFVSNRDGGFEIYLTREAVHGK